MFLFKCPLMLIRQPGLLLFLFFIEIEIEQTFFSSFYST